MQYADNEKTSSSKKGLNEHEWASFSTNTVVPNYKKAWRIDAKCLNINARSHVLRWIGVFRSLLEERE